MGGEYPDGARGRVARARQLRPAPHGPEEEAEAREQDRLWDGALAWRAGEVAVREPAEGEEEWRAVVRGWTRAFWDAQARFAPHSGGPPADRVLALARRARLRRRLRDAL